MKEWTFDIIFVVIFIAISFLIGYYIGGEEECYIHPPDYYGVYFGGWNLTDAMNYVVPTDPYGDWVFVNVRGLDYERCVEIANHECGHHIFQEEFAELCEKNWTRCQEVLE